MQKEVYEFVSQQSGESIVEWRVCSETGKEFPLYQRDQEFYDQMSPTFAGKKFQIYAPTLCPEERQRRRMMFRNERSLYRGTCSATGERMLSAYSPDKPDIVYSFDYRWSDKWNALDYAQEIDFSVPFFEQFRRLYARVPKVNLINGTANTNSLYVNQTNALKNCYLCFDADQTEDSLYCNTIFGLKKCIDCSNVYYSELCYNCVNCTKCYGLRYCTELEDSANCDFSRRSKKCENCFGCVNLVNKQYCIYNEQYTKEAYEERIEIEWRRFRENQQAFMDAMMHFVHSFPQRALYTITSTDSFGNNMYNTNKSLFCFNVGDADHCSYTTFANEHISHCYDYEVWGIHIERILEGITLGEHMYTVCYSFDCWENGSNLYYCAMCISCKDCFGCAGLRNKQYCIFNKQYTKESYEKNVAQLITHMQSTGEWGEFFPISLSPFGYNEVLAGLYHPLNHQEAAVKGYNRQEKNYDPKIPETAVVIEGTDVPKDARTVDDSFLKNIIRCKTSGRPFTLQKQELAFYQSRGLPIPSEHHEERYKRLKQREPDLTLYARTCDKTGEDIVSVYPPELPFEVWKEEVWNQEVYG